MDIADKTSSENIAWCLVVYGF